MSSVVKLETGFSGQIDSGPDALCGLLVAAGKLQPSDVERALRLQREQGDWEKIGSILAKLGLVSEMDVAESLSEQLGLTLVDGADFPAEPLADLGIEPRFLKNNRVLVLDQDETELTVVMSHPQDQHVLDALRLVSNKSVVACLGIPAEIDIALNRLYDSDKRSDDVVDASVSAQYLDDVEQLKELAGEAPVIKLVNQLIHGAAEAGASDIHIEPFEDQLKIRYRVDGLLREVDAPPTQSSAAVISRVKIMANLNIAERRLAQDGRFKQRVRGNEYDLRVSTVPTMYGESVVLRLLQRDSVALDFGPLGFSPQQETVMQEILATPHGILLVTGPTGSGKSTTLYAALRHLNKPERMIITVEDPVEYNIRGINQMQVKPQIGLTFANALRSIVRQDPDVIMIGEMRDTETAQIAVQSALTGHLVLSTLHTNDAAGSVMRMLDMGVEDYLLTSAVIAIQAQRLVRTLCPECREPYAPPREVVERWGLDRFAGNGELTLHKPIGCDHCGNTGYSGRCAILEILPMTDAIRQLVLKRSDVSEIARAAADLGMVSMRDDGLRKAVAGETTVEEVLRVTPEQS
ncbi:MAG: type II secretion system ATPase GspE [Gammaproteobacteria bacterium]|nr:type II secretion system ATPase GspE [Gammaproteobacteria bacterium]MDH3429244.1 type II secretion system ATPase GspE [Gammaproteobacteria bacterium]